MATASSKFKNKRQSHVLEQTAEEKKEAIDNLFASLPTAPPVQAKEPEPKINGVEIFSVLGGGSILVDGVSVNLPVVITQMSKWMKLKEFYRVDSPNSVLRSRRLM